MIRIDELYNNTFLPQMQGRLNHGLHWFDPFGSVKFEDLCNVPPVNDTHDAVRYLFWDQEPLHEDLVDNTLGKFVSMFRHGQRHIITSEHQSENVKRIVDTYGFIPHYYFFHGWAALDWFRGYNRSFLMTPPEDRKIKYTFIAPNRIIGGRRQHRLQMLYNIFYQNMTNNHISCPAVCPAENVTIESLTKNLVGMYPRIQKVFSEQKFPMSFSGETDSPMDSYKLSLFSECAESLLYLVTETVATGRRHHLTEKTFKPICLRMPFVMVGTAGSLEYLRSYGFRTFGHLWDESYDEEINDIQRIEKVAWTLRALHEEPTACKQKLFGYAQEVCEHNYQHFYNGGFEAILWDELKGMLSEF